ncbi:MAG: hypothetical protein AAB946_00445 [Patescibacteria group bacterium]
MSRYNITEKRKKTNTPIQNRFLVLLIGFIIFIFLLKATWNAYLENKKSRQVAENARMELATLEERQFFITDELEKLSTDEGKEARLRQKFGVGKTGEQVAIIVEATNEEASGEGGDFWQRIKNFFTALFQK